jgi:hypothetical protein
MPSDKKPPTKLDPPLKVISFYKNDQEEKDFGDYMFDLLNSEKSDDDNLVHSNKGIVIAVDDDTDMLYMRPYNMEQQEIVFVMEKLKLSILANFEY